MFFQSFFGEVLEGNESAVCCPFPHSIPDTKLTYQETNPSAHVNLEKGVFHCKACGRGYNEVTFIKEILGCTSTQAVRLQAAFNKSQTTYAEWCDIHTVTDAERAFVNNLGISDAVIDTLKLTVHEDQIYFPVFMYGQLIDIRVYNPGGKPKVRSSPGAVAGLVLPFDNWNPDKVTLLCAGEKDMAVARSHGFNAITLTGGETALPATPNSFIGKKVIICYDNDNAGKMGAEKLAQKIKQLNINSLCQVPCKICTGFHEVCSEDKEDITDFFVKYGRTRQDLIKYLNLASEFVPTAPEKKLPMVTLLQASQPQLINRIVQSNVQVIATNEATFSIPAEMTATKLRSTSTADEGMTEGEVRTWELSDSNLKDTLHLMDNNFTEASLQKNYRDLMRIMQKEKYVQIDMLRKLTVYKCHVVDMFETKASDTVPMEYTAYTLGVRLESGKKYKLTHSLIPHPYKGQQLTMIVTAAEQADDSVTQFTITPEVKQHLKLIQEMPGELDEKITEMAERFKAVLGYNGNNMLITTLDLAYHTPLQFNVPNATRTTERGYLDVIIVGESRMGKSSTAEAMRKLYQLGTFTSLAGNAATIAGLIGGSNKTNGAFQTRAGLIPQNHRGLMIFEELGKSHNNILKELTDIRSSNEVRIARVSGSVTLPATVRMITLSNVKTMDGAIKSIAQYPHGIAILTELIGTAEDIARYDIAYISGDKGATHLDPAWAPLEAIPEEVLRTRVRWVWSRTPEQIIIAPEIYVLIVETANALNEKFASHIKLFGPEAWKKLSRVAIAVAGLTVSTDATYENIVVTEEHVVYAGCYLAELYNNDVFKLEQYVQYERRYTEIDDDGVELLQGLYIKAPALLLQLELTAQTTRNTLMAASGKSNEEYNAIMNQLVAGLFITFGKYDILPTERFRKGMSRINRNVSVARIGELQ